MEVLVGPTFSIEVSSPQDNLHVNSSSAAANCIFLKDDDDSLGQEHLISGSFGPAIQINELDNSSDSSSSIGAPDDSEEEEEEEVDSGSSSKGALASLDSLEDSLPVKRGLSNHFAGKSKSFTNLSEVSTSEATVKDLVKPENPFNKRRRLLMANKWCSRRKSSFYSWSNPKSMPLLALAEEEDEEEHQHQDHHRRDEKEDDDDDEDEDNQSSSSAEQDINHHHRHHLTKQISIKLQDRRFKTGFKSHSCFSLTDLQEEEEQYP